MARIRSDARNNKSNRDGSATKRFLVEKLPASILEFADRGRAHGSALAGGPIEAPLVRLGIVQTQGYTFDAACRAINFELLQISAAIPNLSGNGSTVKFDPGSGAG